MLSQKTTREYNKKTSQDFKLLDYLKYFFIFIFFIITVRLFWIQVLGYQHFKNLALSQQEKTEKILSKRGSILSRDGFVLASDIITYKLIANPKIITDKSKYLEIFLRGISFNSPLDQENFKEKASRLLDEQNFYQILRKNLSYDEKTKIEKEKLIGVSFEKEVKRYYPEGFLASHVLGFVGKSETEESVGYYGIEGKNNFLLKGREGRKEYERGALDQKILYQGINTLDAIDGDSLILTIDRTIQYLAETKIKEGVEKYGAKSGQVIIMDPKNGDILAMASYPNFNPYDPFSEFLDYEKKFKPEVLNKNISDSFEPGSVIKPMTIATAIDLGLINDKSIFYDNGPISYSGKNIDNWDRKHLGALDPTLILQKSNNVATAQVGILIGEENLRKYFQNFGFGKKTGIDMEGEENGILRSTKWEDIDIANISFGQGVSATPLQVLTSFNVFANDGKFLRPRIILEIKKSNGEKVEYPVSETNQIISNSTNQMMNQILVNSTKYNEGKYFLLKNYDISGKTGTGQIFREGKYLEDKTNASFVGFLTRSKKFSMFVRLEEPSSSTYASETAMPVWMSIATELINIFNLPPDY